MSRPDTLHGLLQAATELSCEAPAILGVSRKSLSYRALLRHVENTALTLTTLGAGRGDRIAIVLPNGPEAAVCFLSVAAVATCAPLNPAYSAAELEFFLRDLTPKAIIVGGRNDAAVQVAVSLGISVLRLVPEADDSAGLFRLEPTPRATGDAVPDFAQADDTALMLHTSGTTSRPKIVPLSHANLCSSAKNIAASLRLTPDDRCLNVMPLFHIHGLIGALLSSLSAGAGVVCTPGFDALGFFDWLSQFRPTWYTAVPAMHLGITGQARRNPGIASGAGLRLIRSSSSSLSPALMSDLESVFGVPVVQAYGMTEASHQMTVNPLPPGVRKPGSVGGLN